MLPAEISIHCLVLTILSVLVMCNKEWELCYRTNSMLILEGLHKCVQDTNGVRYVELLVCKPYRGAAR